MDPDLPFNPQYVTHQFDSYVVAAGDFFNTSVYLTSKVNLTCLFSGISLNI